MLDRLLSFSMIKFYSVLLALVFFFLTNTILQRQIAFQLNNDVVKRKTEMQSIIAEVRAILVYLNQRVEDKTVCHEQTVVEMRRALFKARYGKDIGFYVDDMLVCTTGLGMLPSPFKESGLLVPGPDDLYLRFDQELVLFDRRFAAIIVKLHAFNVVLDPENMFRRSEGGLDWEVTLQFSPGEFQIIADNLPPGLGIQQRSGEYWRIAQSCDTDDLICVTSGLSNSRYWHNYSAYILLALVATILVWMISFIHLVRWYRRRQSLQTKVKRALKKQHFYCLYQPIVALETDTIIGFEVLARCSDADAVIFPDQFIPCIKDMHKTWEFTEQIIDFLQQDLKQSHDFPDGFRISLNIFPADINNGDVLQLLPKCEALQLRYNLMIEITEDELLGSQQANEYLKTLSKKKVSIAVDDFGTGYANIAQLQELQCDVIKIDRSYTSEIEEGAIKSALIRHVVALAKEMKVDVVAEGIENTLQRQHLLDLDVKYGQGYLFGKPMPMESFRELMHKQSQE